jgi:hypothetical protein
MSLLKPVLAGLLVSLSLNGSMWASDSAAHTEAKAIQCVVEFKYDSVQFDQKKLLGCYSSLKPSDVRYFHVFATASPGGSQAHNQQLSDGRAKAMSAFLKSRFPDVKVHTIGGGINNRFGKSGVVSAILVPEPPVTSSLPTTLTMPPQESVAGSNAPTEGNVASLDPETQSTANLSASSDNRDESFRLAMRIGQDHYSLEKKTAYKALGGEGVWFPKIDGLSTSVRPEVGITGSSLIDDEFLDLYSTHATAGLNARLGTRVLLGGRALAGGLWNADREWTGDAGGEFRLGYEYQHLSVFAGLGKTRATTRIGLDLGMTL